LLGCSSIEGMNRVGCDAKKVQAHFRERMQELTETLGRKRDRKAREKF